MTFNSNLKVIIVGGSVAGLSFANMLEKLGVDFVLLEAYDQIAPQVGASIGLLGNGLRIIDQLGCYEELCKHAPDSLQSSTLRSKDGVLVRHQNLDPLIRGRLGYPFIFMDRQTLLQVLYNNLSQKSKIQTSKRVVGVRLLQDCVKVTTKDGMEYTGDIVVGADGIHSTVRREMWEISGRLKPGYIPQDEWNRIRCEYACIFGISNPCGKWKGGDTSSIYREGFSYFIVGGPEKRVYWFLFFGVGGVKTGRDVPKFTKEDQERIANDHWNDTVDEGLTFGDLYMARRVAVLTSLEEVVFTKWHFRRIMTIGDAAHKIHPLSAQGGNSAIETAAALANCLADGLKNRTEWSESAVEEVFDQVMKLRHHRVTQLMHRAHTRQRVEALDGVFPTFLALHFIPRLKSHRIFDRLYADICPSGKLELISAPRRPKQAPFHDELPSKPRSTTRMFPLIATSFLLLAAFASRLLQQEMPTMTDPFANATTPSATSTDSFPVIPLTGQQLLHYFYYSAMILPFLSIWVAEGTRGRNTWSYICLTFSLLLCQRYGFSIVAPFLYIVNLYKFRSIKGLLPFGREMPASDRAVLPAVLLGYAIPVVLLILFFRAQEPPRAGRLLCESWPIYVGIIASSFPRILGDYRDTTAEATKLVKLYSNTWHDKVYFVTFIISTTAHIATMPLAWTWLTTSVRDLFSPSGLQRPLFDVQYPQDYALRFTQWDMLIFTVESVVWIMARAWMLIRGGILDIPWLKASFLISIGSILIGPGSVASLLWGWQDSVLTDVLNAI